VDEALAALEEAACQPISIQHGSKPKRVPELANFMGEGESAIFHYLVNNPGGSGQSVIIESTDTDCIKIGLLALLRFAAPNSLSTSAGSLGIARWYLRRSDGRLLCLNSLLAALVSIPIPPDMPWQDVVASFVFCFILGGGDDYTHGFHGHPPSNFATVLWESLNEVRPYG
jgi:hypothetical protein